MNNHVATTAKTSLVHTVETVLYTVREHAVYKFVYLEFHFWKLLGNEPNFQTVCAVCSL